MTICPHKKVFIQIMLVIPILIVCIASAVFLLQRNKPLLAEFERLNVDAKKKMIWSGDVIGYQKPGAIVLEETVKELEEKHSSILKGRILINDDIRWINRRGDEVIGFETNDKDIVIWTRSMQYQHDLLDALSKKAAAANKPCKAVKTSTGKIVCVVIADTPQEYTELIRKIYFTGGDIPAPDAPPMPETTEETDTYTQTGR